MMLGIDRRQPVPGRSMQIVFEVQFQPAQALVLGPDIAKNMRCQVAIRVETLVFVGQINALQIQLANPLCNRRVKLPRHPRKVSGRIEPGKDVVLQCEVVVIVEVHDLRQQRRCFAAVFPQFAGHGVGTFDMHRHRKLTKIAVVQHTPPRINLKGPLLLSRSPIHKLGVAHNLQPAQPEHNGRGPQKKESRHPDEPCPSNGCGQHPTRRLLHHSKPLVVLIP